MGGMVAYDDVCWGAVWTFRLLPCDQRPPSLVDETPRRGL